MKGTYEELTTSAPHRSLLRPFHHRIGLADGRRMDHLAHIDLVGACDSDGAQRHLHSRRRCFPYRGCRTGEFLLTWRIHGWLRVGSIREAMVLDLCEIAMVSVPDDLLPSLGASEGF